MRKATISNILHITALAVVVGHASVAEARFKSVAVKLFWHVCKQKASPPPFATVQTHVLRWLPDNVDTEETAVESIAKWAKQANVRLSEEDIKPMIALAKREDEGLDLNLEQMIALNEIYGIMARTPPPKVRVYPMRDDLRHYLKPELASRVTPVSPGRWKYEGEAAEDEFRRLVRAMNKQCKDELLSICVTPKKVDAVVSCGDYSLTMSTAKGLTVGLKPAAFWERPPPQP